MQQTEVPTLMAEIATGDALTLSAAGKMFPGHRGEGGTVNPSTVYRWVTGGTPTPDGRVVKLEAVRVGSRWLTSRAAVARFVTALTDAATPATDPDRKPLPRTTSVSKAASQRADEALKRRGA